MVYNIRLEKSDGAVVVGLNVNFNKAFNTINHECVKLKVIKLIQLI